MGHFEYVSSQKIRIIGQEIAFRLSLDITSEEIATHCIIKAANEGGIVFICSSKALVGMDYSERLLPEMQTQSISKGMNAGAGQIYRAAQHLPIPGAEGLATDEDILHPQAFADGSQASGVITVQMRQDQIVDGLDPGSLQRGNQFLFRPGISPRMVESAKAVSALCVLTPPVSIITVLPYEVWMRLQSAVPALYKVIRFAPQRPEEESRSDQKQGQGISKATL